MTVIGADAFGTDFTWGVSTAAYQIEGAHNKHGKGPSIWDDFTQRKGKIYADQNANQSCDFYQHYHQDISLMHALNIKNFRFSISWSRIFPLGTGRVNQSGVDFYKRVIEFCLELDIQPWITLYHWDLPLELERKGGWTNRQIIDWFGEYVAFCIRTLGDTVKHWMVMNEPLVFTGAGYFLGLHAPGKRGRASFLPALHHALLCQAEGGRIIRELRSDVQVGTTFSCSHIEPANGTTEDYSAVLRMDALLNRTCIEPLLGLGYPVGDLKILQRMEDYIKDGDEKKLHFDMDFIGIQNYTREIVENNFLVPYVQARIIKASDRNVPRTEMNWEVYPPSIYYMLKKFSHYPSIRNIIVTENGAAFADHYCDGSVIDVARKQYLQEYLKQVLRAKKEGAKVSGYFVWTFTDNFEWAEGYQSRFGLVYVDFASQKRTVKSSGLWYSSFLKQKEHGSSLTRDPLNAALATTKLNIGNLGSSVT